MAEVFNSGNGGYTCDLCRVLLWAGFDGKDKRYNRRYTYKTTENEVYETATGKFKFCKKCGIKSPKSRRKELRV